MEEEQRQRRNLPQSCRQKVVGGKMDIGMGKKKKRTELMKFAK